MYIDDLTDEDFKEFFKPFSRYFDFVQNYSLADNDKTIVSIQVFDNRRKIFYKIIFTDFCCDDEYENIRSLTYKSSNEIWEDFMILWLARDKVKQLSYVNTLKENSKRVFDDVRDKYLETIRHYDDLLNSADTTVRS